jgi:uncharacterized protein YdbL (DUF1318 family)
MKKLFLILAAIIFCLGCAKVSVQGTKEPIKVDISMRLDVYQHVEKDIDAIENIVTGTPDKNKPDDQQSLLSFVIGCAYAQEELSPEIQQAALRRKERVSKLYALEEQGVIGENKLGLVKLKDASGGDVSVEELIEAENHDRMIIYKSVAAKNNSSVEEIQKVYAKRLQGDAPSGTPVEILNKESGAYEWKKK